MSSCISRQKEPWASCKSAVLGLIFFASTWTVFLTARETGGDSFPPFVSPVHQSNGQEIQMDLEQSDSGPLLKIQISHDAQVSLIGYSDVTAHAFDDSGKEIALTRQDEKYDPWIDVSTNGRWFAASGFYRLDPKSEHLPNVVTIGYQGETHTFPLFAKAFMDRKMFGTGWVAVFGDVRTPQIFTWQPNTTFLDMIGNAGGPEWDPPKLIVLIRNGKRIKFHRSGGKIEEMARSTPLLPDDVIQVFD